MTIVAELLDINASKFKSSAYIHLTSFKWFLFRCENFLCGYEKVNECSTIKDCWNKGSYYYKTNINPC